MKVRVIHFVILSLAIIALGWVFVSSNATNGKTGAAIGSTYLPVVRSSTASILQAPSTPPEESTAPLPPTPLSSTPPPEQPTGSAAATPTQSVPTDENAFYVAPNGTAQGNGSNDQPWDLATALDQPAVVHPGATIWLRGGTYTGQFNSQLQGTSAMPITVRQVLGERATINGSLYIANGSTTWWGFEVTNSGIANGNRPINAISIFAPNTKLINLIIHDNRGSGIGLWREAPGSEVYGCLIYNNGLSKFEHGIYVQNESGTHSINDNVLFYQSGYGIHGYAAAGQFIRGLELDGNVSFTNGWSSPYASNLLVGGETSASGTRITHNFTYYASNQLNVDMGYTHTTNEDVVIEQNYFAGGQPVLHIGNWSTTSVTNNTLIGSRGMVAYTNNSTANTTWNGNTYINTGATKAFNLNATALSFAQWQQQAGVDTASIYQVTQPTAPQLFLRPNRYDPKRTTLVVYNWPSHTAVDVDVSSVLPLGTQFELHDVQDYFGTPVLSGTYNGGALSIPIAKLRSARPSGDWIPATQAADIKFHTFVLIALN